MIAEITISEVTTIIGVIVGGIVSIIGALVAAFVAIRSSQREAEKERKKDQEINGKKLDVIHELTNSNLTKVTEDLAALRKLVERNAESGIVTTPTTTPPAV